MLQLEQVLERLEEDADPEPCRLRILLYFNCTHIFVADL